MITLEAFITKQNLKKVSANGNTIKYDDIRFHNAMKPECDELLERIEETGFLDDIKEINGNKITNWHMTNRQWVKQYVLFPVLEAEYQVKNHGDVTVNGSKTHKETKPFLTFVIEFKDDDMISWNNSYEHYQYTSGNYECSEEEKNKRLEELNNMFEVANKIANAMGFIHYSEKWGRWYKNKSAIK